MSRRDLSLADRIALLDQIKSQPPNTSYRRLAEITGVPKSTIARVIQQQDKLREEWALREGHRGTSQKRKREGKDPDVEEALSQWFSIVTGQGVHVSGSILKSKSEELAKKLGHKDFKATDGWLSRWKLRHDIKFKKAYSKKDSFDAVNAEQWKSTKLPNLLQKFCEDDIYNAKETGLFYRAVPNGSLSYKHATLMGSKKAMDHVTVLCCSNMSGTDKRKPLVIGKNANPRCFKGLRMDRLPVIYYANKNAWMTSEIFKKWLMSWDVELQQKSRKVLLLLENCVAHPYLDCLKNIQLEFLSSNTTSFMQPMDMGIIKNLKTLFRGKLVNYILEAIEESLLTSSSTATEVSSRVNLLQAVQFIADSWREISSETIQNCFVHCGFMHSGLEVPDMTNSEATLELQYVRNYEEFACIDNSLQCYNENEDCDDAIVEQIVAKHQKTSEDQESDEVDTPELEQVTNQDARKFIAGLRRYFMQEGNEWSPLSALDICADFVHLQSVKRTQQALERTMAHVKCRNNPYPHTRDGIIKRLFVPNEKVAWSVPWPDYDPPMYTMSDMKSKPWADPDISDFQPKWNQLDGNVNRQSHITDYLIENGYPINPIGRCGLRGRGWLGRWGPNHAADPIVTRWKRQNGTVVINETTGHPVLQFIAIQRKDCGEWAIPGGMVDPGEIVTTTLRREFCEEALNSLCLESAEKEKLETRLNSFFNKGEEIYRGYVDDPRNTDNAWIETVVYLFHDDIGDVIGQFNLQAGDDAARVQWTDIGSELLLYASHKDFLHKVSLKLGAHW